MANPHLAGKNQGNNVPKVRFIRTENEHMGDTYGEKHNVIWDCELTDARYNIFTWADHYQLQQYVNKGWKPIELLNFQNFGKDEKGKLGDQVIALMAYLEPLVTANKNLLAAEKRLAEREAELDAKAAKLEEKNPDPKLQENKSDGERPKTDTGHAKGSDGSRDKGSHGARPEAGQRA